MFSIYGLYDSVKSEHVRYIGYTQHDPIDRLIRHIKGVRNFEKKSHKVNWLREVLLTNGTPKVFLIGEASTLENAHILEKLYICEYLKAGHKLTNATDGGDGVHGLKHTEESRVKMSASQILTYQLGRESPCGMRGKKHSEKFCVKMSATQKKRYENLEERKRTSVATKEYFENHPEISAKISARLMGREVSEETRAKISTSQKGKIISEETRAKIKAARKNQAPTNKGRKFSAEWCAKMSAARKGKKLSEETRAKMSASGKEAWQSETRIKAKLVQLQKSLAELEELS